MSTYFVDFSGGSDANDGLSFANRKQTLTGVTAAIAGDDIRVMQSPTATSMAQTAQFTDLSPLVLLTSAVTANITVCDTNWTPSANVGASIVTSGGNYKEGAGALQLIVAAAFTTGKVAYFDLGSSVDYSAYQQVSFAWNPGTNNLGFTAWQLKLCSDSTGNSIVNTFNIPGNVTSNSLTNMTVDNGGALGASIRSVALYVTVDPGAVTARIDNILACKASSAADSLTLTSLIGKGTTGEPYYPLMSINGVTVIIGGWGTLTSGSANLRGYNGTTENVTIQKRETLWTVSNSVQTISTFADIQVSGVEGNPITISGGWNSTDMTTQTDSTYLSQRSGVFNWGMSITGRSWLNVSNFRFYQYYNGIGLGSTSANINVSNIENLGNFAYGLYQTGNAGANTFTGYKCYLTGNYGVGTNGNSQYSSGMIYGNAADGVVFVQNNNVFTNTIIRNNATVAADFNGTNLNYFYGLTSSLSPLGISSGEGGPNYLINANITDTAGVTISSYNQNARVHSMKEGGVAGNHKIYTDGGTIVPVADSNRRTASGFAWLLTPTASFRNSNYPLYLNDIRISCLANVAMTVQVWCKRDNTQVTGRLWIQGGQINGIATSLSASTVGVAGTYEQLAISFTATETGVIDVQLQAYGGTTRSVWFDDFSVTVP